MAVTLVHDCDIERRLSPLALEGDFRDAYLDQIAPTMAHGNGNQASVAVLDAGGKGGIYEHRALFLYDLAAFLPASATLTAAAWWWYVNATDCTDTMEMALVRMRRHDWVENQATWDQYKTGSDWGAAGAEDTDTDRDNGVVASGIVDLDDTGWHTTDVFTLADDAWDNQGKVCTWLAIRTNELSTVGQVFIQAKEIGGSPGYEYAPHHLRVTYTLDGRTFGAVVR